MTHKIRTTNTHIIVELSSKAGHKYEVGYPIKDGYTEEKILENIKSHELQDSPFLSLQWIPGAPQTSPSAEVQKIGIAAGYVSHDRGPIYEYRINFQNSKGWEFQFKDETGDIYPCNTTFNSWHYIDYNSDKATIIGVRNS
ncbi:hypothetical protein [Pseudomonas frederiksbergensis]|uniref:Uncharacterized protein n=1 Tax=Pseudomonas frederiksbergensis TaxID=104087 RepID=A0A423HQX0_9PSED|nr:hypothetical protein [Pseudomonas frederiksbergensis]RON15576.1 hypothetical protein BK662_12575 [Pseudomonas frederiksbergensis]